MAGYLSKLLDAMVDGIEPLFGRSAAANRLVAVDDGAELNFFRVTRGRIKELGASSSLKGSKARQVRRSAGGVVELRLPADRVLTRNINLPAAGREFLAAIIEHRLERLTPWKPDKVLFGYSASREAGADGNMQVDFAATSDDVAAAAVQRLAAFGLVPTALGSSAEKLDRPLQIDLYRGERNVGRRKLRRATGLVLIILALLLIPAVGAAVTANYMASDRLTELEQRLATKRNVIRAAEGAGSAKGRDAELMAAKSEKAAMVALIDRLSTVLPDETYLTELSVEGARIRLVGVSDNAPALISVLDAEDILIDARFAAPVTRDDNGKDNFDITATWTAHDPAAAAAPASDQPAEVTQ